MTYRLLSVEFFACRTRLTLHLATTCLLGESWHIMKGALFVVTLYTLFFGISRMPLLFQQRSNFFPLLSHSALDY